MSNIALINAINENNFEYVEQNDYDLCWSDPIRISSLKMCSLLLNRGHDYKHVISTVTTVELYDAVYSTYVLYMIHIVQ